MKNIKAIIISIFTPLTFFLTLLLLAASFVLGPLYAMAEVVNNAKEDTATFFNRLGNSIMFGGWCYGNECYEKAAKDYYLRAKELYNKYSSPPYNVQLKMGLIQATIVYDNDYQKEFNNGAVDFSDEKNKANAGQYDYRAAKNQIYDLIYNMVSQDSKGVYYIDIPKYDNYLRNTYINRNYPQVLDNMSIEEVIKDIHDRAGYYEPDYVKEDDTISGDIMDLLDAPFRGTECAITSGFEDTRGVNETTNKSHNAVDVVGRTDKNIYSVADGVVVSVDLHPENLYKYWDSQKKMCSCNGTSCLNGYGTVIVIEHTLNGQKYRSRYAHLGSVLVSAGQTVTKGQQIGVEGTSGCSTGSHLHFEFYSTDGHKFDPTSIMSRCATQSATIANCNLENLTVHLTACPGKYFNPNYVTGDYSFKDYVMGVFIGEIGPETYNMEFMKAFAVAVQTFALRRGGYDPNSKVINMRNGTCDQVFKPLTATSEKGRTRIADAYSTMFGSVMIKNNKLLSGSYKAREKDGCGYQKNDMCQVGGNDLAKGGMAYKDILEYYYTIDADYDVVNYCKNAADKVIPGINNSKNNLTCGASNVNDINAELQKLTTKVNNAGVGSRAGVVAAARYLALDFPNKIPYFADESDTKGRYYKVGFNTDKNSGWGCLVTKEGIPTTQQTYGSIYANGLSDSGFVTWAILNGGIKEVGNISSDQLADRGRQIPFGDSQVSDGTVKIGDLFWNGGHVGIIIGIDNDSIYVAEEKDVNNGLVVTTHAKNENTDGYYYILMNGVYGTEGNIPNMW